MYIIFVIKELKSDPESLVDAHCSIANSFSEIPELRQTWLEKISALHEKYENYSEVSFKVNRRECVS